MARKRYKTVIRRGVEYKVEVDKNGRFITGGSWIPQLQQQTTKTKKTKG